MCPSCCADPTDFKSCIIHLERETERVEIKLVGDKDNTDKDKLDELRSLTVPQLKLELRERGLPLSGLKKDLVEHLSNWLIQEHDLGEVIEEEKDGNEIESCEI